MSSDLFKTQVQIAIQTKIKPINLELDDLFIDWFNKSRKHILLSKGGKGYTPIESASAILTHYVSRWVEYIPVYDPVMLLERFNSIDAAVSKIVYIYDLKVLSKLPEYEVAKFFSYTKYLLMNNVRCVFSIDCGFTRADLDSYFKNKQISDHVSTIFGNPRYCKLLEV